MFGNRRKAVLVSAALVVGASLMTACQGSDSDSDAAKGAPAVQGSSPVTSAGNAATPPGSPTTGGNQGGGKSSAGQTSGSGGQAATGTTGGGGSADGGKTAKCRTDDLKITAIDGTIGGDRDKTVAVTFKNNGRDCAMTGYAGVDLKTSAGPLSAKRTGEEAPSIVLKSGTSVSFGINYPANESGGSGVGITGLQVTPPGETKTVTLQWPGAATLPVTDGAGSPVKVGPIGSAGQGG
ncbi:DUF4232 domain-containing protein [Embleya sp. NPDC059259]|uniref:DUF4232 domain-containing protein n=1 Tax=unclassified Embleya TaxID=2699296 RepID=UPI003679B822